MEKRYRRPWRNVCAQPALLVRLVLGCWADLLSQRQALVAVHMSTGEADGAPGALCLMGGWVAEKQSLSHSRVSRPKALFPIEGGPLSVTRSTGCHEVDGM